MEQPRRHSNQTRQATNNADTARFAAPGPVDPLAEPDPTDFGGRTPWKNPQPVRIAAPAGSKPKANLSLGLQPQQIRAFISRAREQLFGGAAGGGKSHLMRVAAISWSMRIPGLQVFLFRRLYADLVLNHMQGETSFPALLAPLVDSGHVEIVKGEIRFWNGSRIYLCHCQNAKALLKYQGAEIQFLLFDELTHFTEEMYRFLRGRCRMGRLQVPKQYAGLFPRILSGANPGGVGHIWVKKTFVKPGQVTIPYAVWKPGRKEGGLLRQFVPSRLEDNKILQRNDPEYEERLEGMGDPLMVRAMREGDWDVVAGSMFGDTWSRQRHICTPFAIPWDWDLWRGADDGFGDPAACYWFAQNPRTLTIYVIRELYAKGMLPGSFAERVKKGDLELELQTTHGEIITNPRILKGVMDSAAFAKTGQEGTHGQAVTSRGEQMNALGCRWTPCEKGPESRKHRAQNLHRLLAPNMKEPVKEGVGRRPGIVFFDTCVQAIESIPTLQRDPKNIEVVADSPLDHSYDAVTYGLQYKQGGFKAVKVTGI